MTINKYPKSIKDLFSNSGEFMGRLRFHDDQGDLRYFNSPYSEQLDLVRALEDPKIKTIVVLKPRQIGQSTANCGHTFFKTFTAKKALRTLIVTDHNKSTDSLFDKLQTYYRELPTSFKQSNPFKINQQQKVMQSLRTGALIDTLTAGGKAEGRAWTYQRFIAEELAKWPRAEEMWASLRSAFHQGSEFKTVIISTARGPGNLFHQKVLDAQDAERRGDTTVKLLFSKWSDHRTYRLSPPDWYKPDDKELELAQLHGLDIEQLYWRWDMIYGASGIGERMFFQEFPMTVEEGFLRNDGAWFDSLILSHRLNELPKELKSEERIYRPPQWGIRYVIGVDPSWCTGGDYAVACVLNQWGEQCAVLSHHTGGTDRFAMDLADLAHRYNNALVLCEGNTGGAGQVIIKQLQYEGVHLWRPSEPGKSHWITAQGSKEAAYSYCRRLVNGDSMELNDHQTINEMMQVVEIDGKIEARSGHDDHSDAYMLACWALRRIDSFTGKKTDRQRITRKLTPIDVVMRNARYMR